MTNTSAYSSTGGNVAGNGGSVTNGQSGASAYSENVVNSGGDGGSSATVHIETDNNGVVQEQTITKTAPPGQSLDIEVGTTSGGASVNVGSYIRTGSSNMTGTTTHGRFAHHTFGVASSTDSTTSTTSTSSGQASSTSATLPLPKMDFGGQLKAFFMHLFSLFGL